MIKNLLANFGENDFYRFVFFFIALAYPAEIMISESVTLSNASVRLIISIVCFVAFVLSFKSEIVKRQLTVIHCFVSLAIVAHLCYSTFYSGLSAVVAIEGYLTTAILSNFFSRKKQFEIYTYCSAIFWGLSVFHVKSFVSPVIFMAAILSILFVVGVATKSRILLMAQIQDKSLKLDALLKAFPDQYYFVTRSGKLINNTKSQAVSLYELFPTSLHPVVSKHIEETLSSNSPRIFQYEHDENSFEARMIPQSSHRLITMIRDVTDRKELEREANRKAGELLLASRQASIGRLAGGIAHEINNPLNVVILTARQSAVCFSRGMKDQFGRSVTSLQDGYRRIQTIINAISMLGGESNHERVEFVSTSELLRALQSRVSAVDGVVFHFENCAQSASVKVDLKLVAEALSQIVRNAVEAIREKGSMGKVEIIVTSNEERVFFAVIDNGVGIKAEAREKIFDPFYTTKAIGVAQGLGLSIAKGVALKFGGDVVLESTSDSKTKVVLSLPMQLSAAA